MNASRKFLLSYILKFITSSLIIYFLIDYIYINFNKILDLKFHLDVFYLIISFIILFFYYMGQFIIWHYITKINKCNIEFKKSIFLRSYSELAKYVPGKVLRYLILFKKYNDANQSKAKLLCSMLIEFIAGVLAAFFLFCISIFFSDFKELKVYRFFALAFLLIFFILVHPLIINKLFNLFNDIFKLFKHEPIELNISYLNMLKIILMYVLNFMVFGIAFMLFIKTFYDINFFNYIYITGTTIAAGIIGMFAIFVPAGIGIREGVLLFTLGLIMPHAIAGIVGLCSRLWLIFGEVIIFCIILAIINFKKLKYK